jgi:hypothetical protein
VRIDSIDGTDRTGPGPNTFGDYYVIYNYFSKSGRLPTGSPDRNFDGLMSFGKLFYRPTFWGPSIQLVSSFYGGGSGNFDRPESGLHDVQTGQWLHIVNVFRQTGMSTLYVNGVRVSEREIPVQFGAANGYDLVFNSFYKMNGAMDDIAVYNYALGSREVSALYQR